MKQSTWNCCKNCYDRFWNFEDSVLFCIVCGDWEQSPTIEVIK